MKRFFFGLFFFSALLILPGCDIQSALPDSLNSKSDLKTKTKSALRAVDQKFDKGNSRIVIVPGYGTPVLGSESYEAYVKKAVAYVNDEANNVVAVVFTGSYTDNKNLSEAEALYRGFDEYADIGGLQKDGIDFYKEECAITTWQNIENSKAVVDNKKTSYDSVTIFGDEGRKEKLIGYGNTVFNKDIVKDRSVVSVDYVGHGFSKSVQSDSERGVVFAAEIAAAYNSDLQDALLKERIGTWTKKYKYDVADNLVKKGCTEFAAYQ
jgi:hypothetical protein